MEEMEPAAGGVGLFLYTPTVDGRKEYILNRMLKVFQSAGIEVFCLDISSTDAFEKLGQIDQYFLSVPFDRKHFVFSMDADGFGLTLKMDGLWVDNIQYNVFTYLTRHPRFFQEELDGINSWYISVLNSCRGGVAYIEEQYPHLDGIEYMLFPAFLGQNSELSFFEKEDEVLFVADNESNTGVQECIKRLVERKLPVTLYGRDWDSIVAEYDGLVQSVPEAVQSYERKLDLMGKKKVVLFWHKNYEAADIDSISAMANGALVVTEKILELSEVFSDGQEVVFFERLQKEKLPDQLEKLWKEPTVMESIAVTGRDKARQLGDVSSFVSKILDRCK